MNEVTVGKNIDSWCGRCKLMLAHTIEAIVGGKVTRAHCNTCGGQHAYRKSAPGTGGKGRTAGTAGRRSKDGPPAIDYQAMLKSKDASSARPYLMSDRFQPRDLISHPTFGVGLVLAVRDASKIDVVFTEGQKTLAQGRAA